MTGMHSSKHIFTAFAMAFFAVSTALADSPNTAEHPSIVADITADSINEVVLDEGVADILEYVEEKVAPKKNENIGYRVQVFSDSNQRTARNEARNKQRSLASKFPQYPTYVSFSSPYWRLKVGDFATQEEANAAAAKIRRAFPQFAREVRVVRDRINAPKK